MERVKIFIDGSNFYHGLKANVKNTKINFKKLIALLCGSDRRLVHTHYYNTPVSQQDDAEKYKSQQIFFGALRSIPHFSIHLGRLVKREEPVECPKCHHKYSNHYRVEKGVDVSIATDMLIFAFDNQYDIAILISEDGDYAHAIEEIQRLHKKVINAHFPRGDHYSVLSRKCDSFIPLSAEYLKDCMFDIS